MDVAPVSAAVAEGLALVVDALPGGGEARPGQVQMAEAVAAGIAKGRHVVVQAGTGTGKSLGYLVPAVLSGSRTVVATATNGGCTMTTWHDRRGHGRLPPSCEA